MGTAPGFHEEVPCWVRDWLSPPRLAPYVAAAGPSGALELYVRNCRASTALFELIGWFEVAWRNNIDRAICARRSGVPHWLFDPTFPLRPQTWDKVSAAKRTIAHRTQNPTSGQIIAELTLGFWRFTARGYWTTVRRTYLSHGFRTPLGHPRRR